MDEKGGLSEDAEEAVLSYLRRVSKALATLCLASNETDVPGSSQEQRVELLIHDIARQLLCACHPHLIGTPLPPPLAELVEQQKRRPELYEDFDKGVWKKNRIDFLRSVLRALPPIALDVAAQVCCDVSQDTTSSIFVLFSNWLPVAPQLAPLVSDLFSRDDFLSPLSYGQDKEEVQFLMAQAAHAVYEFYGKRGEHAVMARWWEWGPLFSMLQPNDDNGDVVMKDYSDDSFDMHHATKWHAARAIGFLLNLRPSAFASYLERLEVRKARPLWVRHPWIVQQEAARAQARWIRGVVSLWETEEFPCISAHQVRRVLPLHPMLVHVGQGIVLVKNGARSETMDSRKDLILTPTTSQNLSLLGAALCSDPFPPPILVCGPPGSGKSSLVRELAHYCSASLLELHVDEETDSKTLIGSFTTTDVPGEFTWRPGALTQAVRAGKWVLMEDVDRVPTEIQAAIVQLLENRVLPLNGKVEQCHANFRIFGTCTTSAASGRLSGKKLVSPTLWRKVHVQPLAFSELKDVAESLYPSMPPVVCEAALNIFKVLDQSGRVDESDSSTADSDVAMAVSVPQTRASPFRTTGRHASVRDFLKLLSRISHTVAFEPNVSYATEAQRTLCLAETYDIFCASYSSVEERKEFVSQVAAPHWGITADLAVQYIEARCPSITPGTHCTEIGRAKIPAAPHRMNVDGSSRPFAPTNSSLRLMESIGVCVSENEPTLLVGETGCGKTSLLQQLARCTDRELIVQNLSLQTDSTDLLGGYRPLEMRHIARKVYLEFVDIFVATFSRKQNTEFLDFASSLLEKKQWKKLAQCFRRAASLGLAKVKERGTGTEKQNLDSDMPGLNAWTAFRNRAELFERQRLACDSGLAFAFTEGALVDAIRTGKWVLLDEINLASSETLQRLCGLLDDSTGSVTLTERGDAEALRRHPDFRLFAAMNPATDAGKKDLPPSIRSRFSELYVDELLDAIELRTVAAQYLQGVVSVRETPLEHSETIASAVDVYLKCRDLAEKELVDSAGHKPRYTMRTMCRALSAARNLVVQQRLALNRSLLEGFELAFEGALDSESTKVVKRVLRAHLGKNVSSDNLDHPSRRPKSQGEDEGYVLVKPFWLKSGPLKRADWSEVAVSGRSKFILTDSMSTNLRRLARAVTAGPWPVLLEGPTSAGKTTLVEYLAARLGHQVVRINNHEHTDVQEYTGGYSSDSNGSLSFRDGILVRALRQGHWVILDELNLAPSEVLEALNRLLDDNRELYLPEVDETVTPHPNFRLFATQNPSGAYGGRKPLSRAFRNRFVEIHMGDIPADEMRVILENRCACPPSHAKALVKIMVALRHRRNSHGVFLGKDGLITPRDLLRWAERGGSSKLELAQEGYMLIAERLRNEEEKAIVKEEIETHLKVPINCDDIYYGERSEARKILVSVPQAQNGLTGEAAFSLSSVAPTHSLLRLVTLVLRCMRQKEPVLLVGDTGCGKTTVVQLLSETLPRLLHVVNCHATTETSDLIGGLRPVRGRGMIVREIHEKFMEFLDLYPDKEGLSRCTFPEYISLRSHDRGVLVEKNMNNEGGSVNLPDDAATTMVSLANMLWNRLPSGTFESGAPSLNDSPQSKKRKLTSGVSLDVSSELPPKYTRLELLFNDMRALSRRFSSLFEWADGPLVTAMRSGHMILLDEMSLAEDAVLERLNSVLEPSRTLVLAEKSGNTMDVDGLASHTVVGHDDFLIFATMNPGGDFGKRELSPALRSRFTEIWVPPITDPSDIEMVLRHTLAAMPSSRCDKGMLLRKILSYVNWFNVDVCGKPASPCANLALSLRDVIAWARFVVDVSNAIEDIDVWPLFCHGACMMHLDGLGLGTGLSNDDVIATKQAAMAFLSEAVPEKERAKSLATFKLDSQKRFVSKQRFGILPFTIPLGTIPVPEAQFNFKAPTTALNLIRVLRAMQIPKPILLEGSPGVGKTSLVSALASASGHRIVRINLSEQTDMSDLMGSDLPDPGETDGQSSSFKWCDGVLLRAIKRGDWVLLDELNLASQSVLEGLNSCLDHRASVFIPELGKTFQCPPTFRVFAAQNPLAQGGGRKGLPKSFLNRFTKVYVESLTEDDLQSILASRFPQVPATFAAAMVKFNDAVHQDVVENHRYGDSGSPWEFNLRDVFRWCDLLVSTGGEATPETVARIASHIYLQRFRTWEDRRALSLLYAEYFGTDLVSLPASLIHVTDTSVAVGNACLERYSLSIDVLSEQAWDRESTLPRSLLRPFEAVSRCVMMKWPCLLVGLAGCGKSLLVKSLAELCNAPVINVSLTPATDVNELVGCFEQVDSTEDKNEALRILHILHDAACTYLNETREQILLLQQISRYYHSLPGSSTSEFVVAGLELLELFSVGAKVSKSFFLHSNKHLDNVRTVLDKIDGILQGQRGQDDKHFRWVDGVLVTAMTRGYWIHIENVNLCPASVLDRLNPIMEEGGELLLTECGNSGQNGNSHRTVRPHSNFRMFLSMNPELGEVSRAMRNRCVEVSLIPFSEESNEIESSQDVTCNIVDSLDVLSSAGIRLVQLGANMLKLHMTEARNSKENGSELPSTKSIRECGLLVDGLCSRGGDAQSTLDFSLHLSYEFSEIQCGQLQQELLTFKPGTLDSSVVKSPCLRWGWSFDPKEARLLFESRAVKLFTGWASPPSKPSVLLSFLSTTDAQAETRLAFTSNSNAQVLFSVPDRSDWFSTLRNNLVALFLEKSSSASDLMVRSTTLDGYDDAASESIRFMSSVLAEAITLFSRQSPDNVSGVKGQISPLANSVQPPSFVQDNIVLLIMSGRLTQLLKEEVVYKNVTGLDVSTVPSKSVMSIIETSACLFEGKLERSLVSCPVTPILYPFFRSMDDWITDILTVPECIEKVSSHASEELKMFLVHRDRLWTYLHESIYRPPTQSSFLGVDEGGFIVLWVWLKKRLHDFQRTVVSVAAPQATLSRKKMQRFSNMVEAIDHVIFDTGENLSSIADTLWKNGGHPIVPRLAEQWEAISELQESSQACSLLGCRSASETQGADECVKFDLRDLIKVNHPSLFVNKEEKADLLAALCMCFWASTDEVRESRGKNTLQYGKQPIYNGLREQLASRQQAFAAQLRSLSVDTRIATVENLLDMEKLSSLKDGVTPPDKNFVDDFLHSLLYRFSQIQVSPIAEFWCVKEEAALVEILAETLLESESVDIFGKVVDLAPRLRRFIAVALQRTVLPVVDLRPYQTLVWVSDGLTVGAESMRHLLQCLLPRIMNSLSCRKWQNLFGKLEVISDELELPVLWDFETSGSTETDFADDSEAWSATFLFGPPRLCQGVRTEVMFRLVGPEIASRLDISGKPKYCTIENHDVRKKQAQNILELYSSLEFPLVPERLSIPNELRYLIVQVFESMKDFFPNDAGEELLAAVRSPSLFLKLSESHVRDLLTSCEHPAFKECLDSAVFPLVKSIRSVLSHQSSQESTALCWIYVGLLRMNLLVPRSPLDPGRKPIAKVTQFDRYTDELQGKLVARRLDSGFIFGNFSAGNPACKDIVNEAERIVEKRTKQQRKTVERSSTAAPFIGLFRETRQFCKTVIGPDGAPSLIQFICKAGKGTRDVHEARCREQNWQDTAGAFCLRILSQFAQYEDVSFPFINAIQNVRDGIRLLAELYLTPMDHSVVRTGTSLSSLLSFPTGNVFEDARFAALAASQFSPNETETASKDMERCKFALSLASLCRIGIQKLSRPGKLKTSVVLSAHSLFHSLALACSVERDVIENEIRNTDEAAFEKDYREQFPNHIEEFNSLLHTVEDNEDLNEHKKHDGDVMTTTNWRLSETQITFLCSLHKDLFATEVDAADDTSRIHSFCAAYAAAFLVARTSPQASYALSSDSAHIGSHVMAFCLSLGVGSGHGVLSDASQSPNFHQSSNPQEVLKAARPVQNIIARATQLLTAFPGNEVLISLLRVAERIRKLLVSSTPVGKVMSGLEVILRKAQEWEQHASSLVKLGEALREVSTLVASWRKLELQNWATLLDARERRFQMRARRHWPRLYNILLGADNKRNECSTLPGDSYLSKAPVWVWKGTRTDMKSIARVSTDKDIDEELLALSQAMDTFLLTAALGEFQERLELVETFARQISSMSYYDGRSDLWRVKLSRMLFSLWSYYMQFLPGIISRIGEFRLPIEAKLRDEVKLAKWDEQSYYALTDSTEKNHRKLMKLLREYDDLLELTVSSVLEKQLCHGVRSAESIDSEPCHSIPPSKLMFPLLDHLPNKNETLAKSLDGSLQHRSWAGQNETGLICDKYVTKMSHYSRKMSTIFRARYPDGLTWSHVGEEQVFALTASIFERIDALRSSKASKPMKERALVDLFKALKNNGYRSTKWSVPEQTRTMAHLFQLPRSACTNSFLASEEIIALEGAMLYFERTTTEVNRLRSEVSMFGSKYMSQREIQMMLSFAEHGLFLLCQQKCVIAQFVSQTASVAELLAPIFSLRSLPLGQTKLRSSLEEFNEAYLSASENLKQLRLLLKMAAPLVEKGSKAETVRDVTSVIESSISRLKGYEVSTVPEIVSSAHLSNATSTLPMLEEVKRLLKACQQRCKMIGCLPSDIFTCCISEIERVAGVIALVRSEPSSMPVKLSDLTDRVSLSVQKVLLAVQGLCNVDPPAKERNEDGVLSEQAIFECHSLASKEFEAIDLEWLGKSLLSIVDDLRSIHDTSTVSETNRDYCAAVVEDLSFVVKQLLEVSRQNLVDFISFFRGTAKLHYVLARLFRVLVSKGYCADDVADAEGNGEGDISGMNFEDDQEGTGMGEGEGKQDVTDQLESEEQLLGLKDQDKEDDLDKQGESQQLNEEEAKQGMEMEGDFAGDMFDVPDEPQEADDQDGEEEEELEREMGDGNDPNEEVVDEKMWDESDDEGDQNQAEEKFEKESSVKGEALEDELRTREDGEDAGNGKDTSNQEQEKAAGDDEVTGKDDAGNDESEINDDLEDKYEDKTPGVEVRDDKNDAEEMKEDPDEQMELDGNLNLDETDDVQDGNDDGSMDIDEETKEGENEEGDENACGVAEDEDDEASASSELQANPLQTGGHQGDKDDIEEDNEAVDISEENNECPEDMPEVEFSGNDNAPQEAQGVSSRDGKDSVMAKLEDGEEGEADDGKSDEKQPISAEDVKQDATTGGAVGEGTGEGDKGESVPGNESTGQSEEDPISAPNPFRSPGDATKYWHKKLRMFEGDDKSTEKEEIVDNDLEESKESAGDFEFVSQEQQSTTQVLGAADETEAAQLEEEQNAERSDDEDEKIKHPKRENEHDSNPTGEPKSRSMGKKNSTESQMKTHVSDEDHGADEASDVGMEHEEADAEAASDSDDEKVDEIGNRVVTDLSQLNVNETGQTSMGVEATKALVEEESFTEITANDMAEARLRWSKIQGETQHLARRLCEKLRLVMEPLVATKLKGDYRTGKRINMKRVIGYIASGYRKDKIWLRRTKPAKRNYRVLLAVDNSESMHKSGAGEMALAAMATLAVGMSQLEIGELGVASFGEEMRLLHPFHLPFTSESGTNTVQNFPFDEKRTRTALCVESALSVLESQGDAAAMQLVFLISDGRIERDSRSSLRRLVREMVERNVLLVMIIVEGEKGGLQKKKDSIVHMKEVTFENGKPKVKQFIEDYPFPYYMVIDDMQTLPEILGDALRQWFEMIAQLKSS